MNTRLITHTAIDFTEEERETLFAAHKIMNSVMHLLSKSNIDMIHVVSPDDIQDSAYYAFEKLDACNEILDVLSSGEEITIC